MLVFDLGYNRGAFSRKIKNIYVHAKIIGVDANSNFSTNDVHFINAAITDKLEEKIDFHICDDNLDISSINTDWIEKIRHNHFYENSHRIEKITSITIDYLIEKYGIPDLIKLDIEGAELMALNGLSVKAGLILFEFSEEYFFNAIKCVDRLKQLGYNEFSYTLNDDNFNINLEYHKWEDLGLQNIMRPNEKEYWGMIYAK